MNLTNNCFICVNPSLVPEILKLENCAESKEETSSHEGTNAQRQRSF